MSAFTTINDLVSTLYYKSHYFNLIEYFTNKQINLLWGKTPKFNTERKELEKFYNKLFEYNQLWNTFMLNERVLAQYGMSIPLFGRTRNDPKDPTAYYITICNPNFFSRVGKINEQEGAGTIYYQYVQDNVHGIIQDSYTNEKIVRNYWAGDESEITIGLAHGKIPEGMQLKDRVEMKNELGCIPFVQMVNRAFKDWNLLNNWNYYPSWLPVYKLQFALDAVFDNTVWENEASKTRMYGNWNPNEMAKLQQDPLNSLDFTKNFFVNTLYKAGGGDTPDVGLQVIGGNPQFDKYQGLISYYINLTAKGWFMSPDNNVSTRKTESEMIYQAQDDIATATQLSMMRQNQWYRFFDKLFISAGLMKANEERPYSFELQPNLVFDEMRKTETLIEQLDAGLITKEKALSQLHNINDAGARNMKKEIDKQLDERYELERERIEVTDAKQSNQSVSSDEHKDGSGERLQHPTKSNQ